MDQVWLTSKPLPPWELVGSHKDGPFVCSADQVLGWSHLQGAYRLAGNSGLMPRTLSQHPNKSVS